MEAWVCTDMLSRSWGRWIKSFGLSLLWAALFQYALIQVCVVFSAQSIAKGLSSLPTLVSFLAALLWLSGSRWAKQSLWLNASGLIFFVAGLIANALGMPYATPGILAVVLSTIVIGKVRDVGEKRSTPLGITNHPHPSVVLDQAQVRSIAAALSSMPYSLVLARLGGQVLQQLRTECEAGEFGILLHRTDDGTASAVIGSYEPIGIRMSTDSRRVHWDSAIASFGLDVSELSPYTRPADIRLPSGTEVTLPAGLAHGTWILVCEKPSRELAEALAEGLSRSGWRVTSPESSLLQRIGQLLKIRAMCTAFVSAKGTPSSPHRLELRIRAWSPSLVEDGATGLIFPPRASGIEQFLPRNLTIPLPNESPVMIYGTGQVKEWLEGRWT